MSLVAQSKTSIRNWNQPLKGDAEAILRKSGVIRELGTETVAHAELMLEVDLQIWGAS